MESKSNPAVKLGREKLISHAGYKCSIAAASAYVNEGLSPKRPDALLIRLLLLNGCLPSLL